MSILTCALEYNHVDLFIFSMKIFYCTQLDSLCLKIRFQWLCAQIANRSASSIDNCQLLKWTNFFIIFF